LYKNFLAWSKKEGDKKAMGMGGVAGSPSDTAPPALLVVGMISARIVRVKMWNHAIKMMLLGGAAIVIGVIVGKFVKMG
jgi:uncharacterized spore protein YtfJ